MASSKSTTCGAFMPRMSCNLARVMVLIKDTVPVCPSALSKRTVSLVSPLVFHSVVAHRISFEGIPDRFQRRTNWSAADIVPWCYGSK
jgi:hypothetical protein